MAEDKRKQIAKMMSSKSASAKELNDLLKQLDEKYKGYMTRDQILLAGKVIKKRIELENEVRQLSWYARNPEMIKFFDKESFEAGDKKGISEALKKRQDKKTKMLEKMEKEGTAGQLFYEPDELLDTRQGMKKSPGVKGIEQDLISPKDERGRFDPNPKSWGTYSEAAPVSDVQRVRLPPQPGSTWEYKDGQPMEVEKGQYQPNETIEATPIDKYPDNSGYGIEQLRMIAAQGRQIASRPVEEVDEIEFRLAPKGRKGPGPILTKQGSPYGEEESKKLREKESLDFVNRKVKEARTPEEEASTLRGMSKDEQHQFYMQTSDKVQNRIVQFINAGFSPEEARKKAIYEDLEIKIKDEMGSGGNYEEEYPFSKPGEPPSELEKFEQMKKLDPNSVIREGDLGSYDVNQLHKLAMLRRSERNG